MTRTISAANPAKGKPAMKLHVAALTALLATTTAAPVFAVEGGTGAYLLGSRDALAGIAPPPGFYFSMELWNLQGSVPVLPLGGLALSDATSSANVAKLNFTQSFGSELWGGQPFITVTVPLVSGSLSFNGELNSGLSGTFTDEETGFGDLTITPALGFNSGMNHWVFAASVFVPSGFYQNASVSIPDRSITALSFSKNRWAITPTVAYTYLNTNNGLELSGSANVTFSAVNETTDYQTAPEAVIEFAAMQHLPGGWSAGITGYAYQQLGEDSGAGAEQIKAVTGAESLQASVMGIGPMVTYSTILGGRSVSFEAKYLNEFNARRRFESDVIEASFSIKF